MVNHWRKLSFRWIPANCLLCGLATHRPTEICHHCEHSLPWLEHSCLTCALPIQSSAIFCGECQQHPPPFESCLSPWRYEAPVAQLIHAYKFNRQHAAGQLLAELFLAWIKQHLTTPPDLITAIPLHWRRTWSRGFNQSQLLADQISQQLQIPSNPHLLLRASGTRNQADLDASERRRNMRHAFSVKRNAPAQLAGKRIALLDDVVTTGSTARAASSELLRAGASAVEIWCLARTP